MSSAPDERRHGPDCACHRCLGCQPANTLALVHGATSARQTAPVARAQRRRFLRRIGLRASDLDGVGAALLDNWSVAGMIEPKSRKGTREVPLTATLREGLTAPLLATGRRGADLVFGRTATVPFVPKLVRERARKGMGSCRGRCVPDPRGVAYRGGGVSRGASTALLISPSRRRSSRSWDSDRFARVDRAAPVIPWSWLEDASVDTCSIACDDRITNYCGRRES